MDGSIWIIISNTQEIQDGQYFLACVIPLVYHSTLVDKGVLITWQSGGFLIPQHYTSKQIPHFQRASCLFPGLL